MHHRGFAKIAGPGEHPGAAPPGGPWVALEKVHGAQMVVAIAGDVVQLGKRKAWLRHDDPFAAAFPAAVAALSPAAEEQLRAEILAVADAALT